MPDQATNFEALTNMDAFNLITAEIFSELYEHFPMGVHLYPDEVVGKILPEGQCFTNVPRPPEPYMATVRYSEANFTTLGWRYIGLITATIEWHVSSAYIFRMGDRPGTHPIALPLLPYSLAPLGLTALNKVPDGLAPTETTGRRLAALSKAAGSEAGRIAIGEVVGQVIGAAGRAFAGF